jgi:hypothetical protein
MQKRIKEGGFKMGDDQIGLYNLSVTRAWHYWTLTHHYQISIMDTISSFSFSVLDKGDGWDVMFHLP